MSESEAVKIQHRLAYRDLLECIEFQEINIIPWEDPIMEQFQVQIGREAKNLSSSFSGF